MCLLKILKIKNDVKQSANKFEDFSRKAKETLNYYKEMKNKEKQQKKLQTI